MEDLCRLDPTVSSSCSDDTLRVGVGSFALGNYTAAATTTTTSTSEFHRPFVTSMLQFDTDATQGSDMSDLIKAQIAAHPRYPNLVSAYIECQKVGAPPELASLLEEICRENYTKRTCSEIGADPELDDFMESYCEVLLRYKEELSKPFDEATTFFSNIESQLSNLCKGALTRTSDYRSEFEGFSPYPEVKIMQYWSGVKGTATHQKDEAAGTSEEELSYGEGEAAEYQDSFSGLQGEEDVKGMLMRKYSGYLSSLRKEFLKKKKKGKLPKDARTALMDWWNSHYRWPYPTEEEKVKLSEATGLDQKQVNNWFINQRKRHWKPSEDMRFALMDGVSGNIGEPMYFKSGDGHHN